MKTTSILLALTVAAFAAHAQPKMLWDKTLGGAQADYLNALAPTADGGFYVGGGTDSYAPGGDKSENGFGARNFWLVRVGPDGQKIWDKTYGSSIWDEAFDLVVTADGGVLMGGESRSPAGAYKSENSRGGSDFWLIRVDAKGQKIWDKTLGSAGEDILSAIVATDNSGFLVGGGSTGKTGNEKSEDSRGNGSNDYWVVRLNTDGTKLWDKTFGCAGEDVLRTILRTADGGFLLGGKSNGGADNDRTDAGRGKDDFWVVRLDANGNKLWDKAFGGADNDDLYALAPAGDGFLLGGSSFSGAGGDKTDAGRGVDDFWVIRIDADGNKLWDKTFGGSALDELRAIVATDDGGFVLGGESWSEATGDKSSPQKDKKPVGGDFWLVRIDSAGNKIWDGSWGGDDWDNLYRMAPTSDRGYVLGGWTDSKPGGDKSEPTRGNRDFWLVRLGPDLTAALRPEVTPAFTLYPNPTEDVLHLSNLNARNSQLSIVDVTGRLLLSQTVSGPSAEIDVRALPAGLYLLQIDGTAQRFVKQ